MAKEEKSKDKMNLEGEEYEVDGVWEIVLCGASESLTRQNAESSSNVSSAHRKDIL